MPRCPFCREFSYDEMDSFVCRCGEVLPERVHDYRRERCMCGKSVVPQMDDVDFTQIFPTAL